MHNTLVAAVGGGGPSMGGGGLDGLLAGLLGGALGGAAFSGQEPMISANYAFDLNAPFKLI
jgi:hypothetical protein